LEFWAAARFAQAGVDALVCVTECGTFPIFVWCD
jgi:hypothetical protein